MHRIGAFSRAAVHNACGVKLNEPSPTTVTTARSGHAIFAPTAAGSAHPSAPPLVRKTRESAGNAVWRNSGRDDDTASSKNSVPGGNVALSASVSVASEIAP